ncbi:GNAT family N-acetyltransferase [Longispora sp. NPDC051575]|uniref:GNAT family N-acetyltransferase n=1 Tax=Longispora sp. NPDC051575 TaxID=3154943 RepID=UPI00341C3DFF
MDILALDPTDPAAVAARHALGRDILAHDIPDFPEQTLADLDAELRHPWPGQRVEHWLAVDDGRPVGYLDVELNTIDNLDNCRVLLGVHPAERRRGVGRALHAKALERAAANGCRRIGGGGADTGPGGTEATYGPGSHFARAVGARRALDEVRRRWTPDTAGDLDALLAESWSHAAGYELVTWREAAPDAVVAGIAYLDGRLNDDAPTGDLVLEPSRYDTDRIRAREAAGVARGCRAFGVGLVHTATGRLAAYSALSLDGGNDWHGWQDNTIADPDHRGRRLGTVAKLENLRFARSAVPELRAVDTWNAAENGHMIAINERIGFRAVDTWAYWQQEL